VALEAQDITTGLKKEDFPSFGNSKNSYAEIQGVRSE
jgi:hypothetical protein